MAVVTLLSDFGFGKYVAAMKGVVLSIHPQATVVDLDHGIEPQNVREGAFVLASAVPYFPPAVHVGVVDPGVGTGRRALIVRSDRGIFVGPDNGLLLPAARRLGFRRAYAVTEEEYVLTPTSDTFHGRDVFAPVGAHLSRGVPPEEIGEPVDDPVDLDFGSYRVEEDAIRGEVIFRDRFGNLSTNVPREALPPWMEPGKRYVVEIGEGRLLPFVRTYGEVSTGDPLLTVSSDGYLEVALRQGSAADRLGMRPGDPFVLRPGPDENPM